MDFFTPYKRICVKIGSALLVDQKDGLKSQWLEALVHDLAALKRQGHDIIVVSSGAIALGRTLLDLPQAPLKLEESQAAASVGQIALAKAWNDAFAPHKLNTGQILLTLGDTEERRRYLNARATMNTLLKLNTIPIINENDTVATTEIRYGDNDRLAARVAAMMNADLLVLLSDIDGLYTAPPQTDPDAELIPHITQITPEIDAMAGGAASTLSRGGMRTKIDAARIATRAGTAMIIASGLHQNPLAALANQGRHSLFEPDPAPESAYKTWIAGQLEPSGTLTIDQGALKALHSGKSLLAAGIRQIAGQFDRGDVVAIIDKDGHEVARGLVNYDAQDALKIIGKQSAEIHDILGYAARNALVHRDDLVLTEKEPAP